MAKKILNTDVDILGLLNLPLLNNEAPLHVLTLNNDDDVVIRTLPEILSDIGVTGNYQLLSEKGQANGYVPLDSTGEIPSQYLPDIDTTETDPIFTSSPARSITDTNINNWNEAFYWGDHALAGYVPETRTLSNGPGINPIGNLSLSRTISLDFDYLDGRYASGLLQREAALVASEDNITLSGLQTIDGIALSEGDRVLLLGQTDPADNGVYLASTGTWPRATDFDEPNFEEVSQGASVFVSSGVDLGGTGWTLQTENPITIGTTPLIFIQYAGTSNYVAGNLIDIIGNSINHEAGTWSNKSNLSGATVISNLAVDAYGHLTNWTTRTLTPASIGAEPSFAKNNAFNKNFGTSAGTVAQGNHTHTFSSITNKPTTLSGYGITNAYTKSETLQYFLRKDVSDTMDGTLTAVGFNGDGSGLTGVIKHNSSGVNTSTGGVINTNDGQIYYHSNSANNYGGTLPAEYGLLYQFQGSTTNRHFSIFHNNNSTDFYLGSWDTNNNPTWNEIWHDGNQRSDSQNDNRYVQQTRTISTGTGLTGGGNLSSNRTISVNFGTGSSDVARGNDSRINNGQTAYGWGNHASAGYVPSSRTITAGGGLSGGGNLSSNRTLSVDSTVARTNTSETFSSTVTATNFILSSDRRLKENIESLGNGYYTFNFKDDKTKRKRYGAMADEVKEYAPELIYENEEGYEQVGYIDFLIKKIAELENKINNL